MRLTLRNLLAYMDDLLEPADAKEIGRKVEESDFATGLMHRTRDVTRRLRLGAPKLEGKGMGGDANTVAEYLDNGLPSERVPDFERVCLESDIHLAEVASCHQILALVLGEPADVDPESKQRMYRLIAESQALPETDKAAEKNAEAPERLQVAPERKHIEVKRRKRRKKATVPDYLREAHEADRSSGLKWLILGTVVAFVAVGLFLFRNDLRDFVAGAPETEATDAAEASKPKGKRTPRKQADGKSVKGQEIDGQKIDDQQDDEKSTRPESNDSEAADSADDRAKKDDREAESPSGDDVGDGAAKDKAVVEVAEDGADAAHDLKTPDLKGKESPVEDAPAAPMPPSSDSPAPGLPRPDGAPPAKSDDAADVPAASSVGRLVFQEEVLLRAEANGEWRRVPNRNDKLFAGDLVLAPPAYQPAISLGDLTVTLLGGTSLMLGGVDSAGVPDVVISEGRLSIVFDSSRSKIHVQVKDGPAFTLLGDHEASAGLEVRRTLAVGADPEKFAAPLAVVLHVPEGDVTITGSDGVETAVASPSTHVLLGPPLPPPDPKVKTPPKISFPKWVTQQDVSDIDRKAAVQVEAQLDGGVSAALRLKELAATSKRVEVIALAMRCLASIGDYEGCIPLLNDSTKSAYWDSLIDSLRTALARGTNEAAQVRAALEKQRGAVGPRLYRLLYGISDADLPAESPQLARDLDHADLDVRVLSFWNLREITGVSLNYRPEAPAARRREAVNKWKLREERGDVKRK